LRPGTAGGGGDAAAHAAARMVFVQRSLAGPDGDSGILAVSEQVFAIAARRLSPTEILENLHKWIQENKLSFLIAL